MAHELPSHAKLLPDDGISYEDVDLPTSRVPYMPQNHHLIEYATVDVKYESMITQYFQPVMLKWRPEELKPWPSPGKYFLFVDRRCTR